VRHVAGESLMALRLAAAAALAAGVLLTGSIARRLGAGTFGESLAMAGMAIAPELLAVGSFYSMNVFDLLLWTAAVRVVIDALDRPRPATWALLGLVLGLGLMNKISVLWLGAGVAAALVLTPARRQLLTPWPYVAAAVAAILFLPHVLWQIAHGWPTLEFMRNAASGKMQQNTPLSFMADQVINLHPITLPLWGAGLIGLLLAPRLRRFRGLAIVWLTVAAILILNRTSRSGYLLPAYPALFAAGAVLLEQRLASRAARAAVVAVLVAAGAATVPLAVPILSTDAYVRYSRALGQAPGTEEKKELGRLPQFFADRQGWDAIVDDVARAWDRLAPDERADAVVLTGNYGEAGAIELLGRARGLAATSGHNNYWLWGTGGRGTRTLIVLSRRPERLRAWWGDVEAAGETSCGDCMPYENHVPIWICRRPLMPLAARWPDLRHYE
jgi:Dolichyl-phosphate-mannose-protein mannosyltransferase